MFLIHQNLFILAPKRSPSAPAFWIYYSYYFIFCINIKVFKKFLSFLHHLIDFLTHKLATEVIEWFISSHILSRLKFKSYKDIKKLMSDLKMVYAAPTEENALNELELFKDKWDSKYPKIYKSWYDNWATLSTYFKYPEAVRRLIYTTNAIEGFNRQLRKVTKSKTVFPSDDSLLKMLYLATMDITKKWTGHRQDWGQIHSQLEIYFEERLSGRNL